MKHKSRSLYGAALFLVMVHLFSAPHLTFEYKIIFSYI